eukprot:6276626-Amphidinium_carterae.1
MLGFSHSLLRQLYNYARLTCGSSRPEDKFSQNPKHRKCTSCLVNAAVPTLADLRKAQHNRARQHVRNCEEVEEIAKRWKKSQL